NVSHIYVYIITHVILLTHKVLVNDLLPRLPSQSRPEPSPEGEDHRFGLESQRASACRLWPESRERVERERVAELLGLSSMKTIPPPCPEPLSGQRYWRSLEPLADS